MSQTRKSKKVIGFIIGFAIGGFIGAITMSICAVAHSKNEEDE